MSIFAIPAAPLRASRRIALLALAVASAVLLLVAGRAAAPAPTSTGVVSPALAQLAAAEPGTPVEVIVQGGGVASSRAAVSAAGGATTRELPLIGAVVARLPASAARALALAPEVGAVSLNAAVERTSVVDPALLRTSFNQSVRAERGWGAGLTGRGVGVAVIDTGIQGDLPDFRTSPADARSRVVASAVVHPGADDAGDAFGHGTHVAGIIAGNGTNRDAGDPLRGRYAGVAPEAHLIAVKVDDGAGEATVADVIDGLQFVVDHRAELGIRVVNLSLRSAEPQSYKTDPLNAAVEQAWFAGLVVVAAAGNAGAAETAVQHAPANDPFVITVGGVDDRGTKSIDDDQLATWSSRGTTQDGFTKPEVVAPGARIASTMGPAAAYRSLCPQCVVDGAYFRVGGTSMAAAVVSGQAALLLQAHPDLTPDQVKATIIRRTRAVVEASTTSGELVDAQGRPMPASTTTTTTVTGAEIAVDKSLSGVIREPANGGLAPSALLDPVSRTIDWSRAGWSRAGWSQATDGLRAGWSRAGWSYVPSSWLRAGWSATPASCADLERAGWSRAGWSAEDLRSAESSCLEMDPTRAGWSRAGWSRAGWSTSFDK